MTSLPRPINKQGAVKGRWFEHHRRSRYEVMKRACGVCEVDGCTNAAEEWAHLAGRRHLLAEPWCSSPAMTMGLCRSHHNAVDRGLDPDLLERMRWIGAVRLCADEHAPLTLLNDRDVLGAIRAVEEWLTERERAG